MATYFDRYIMDPWGKPYQGIHEVSAVQKFKVGARYEEPGPLGRVFHYAKNSSAAILVAGHVVSSAAIGGATTTIQSQCPVKVVSAAGETKVYIWALTTEQPAELYAEGTAVIATVADAPDSWRTYAIKTNTTLLTAGATTGYIELYDPLVVATTTSDLVNLATNPFMNVVTHPITTPIGMPLGVPLYNVPVSQWFWCQTWGPVGVLCTTAAGSAGVGDSVDLAVAGSSFTDDAAANGLELIGMNQMIGTIARSKVTYLQLVA